MKHRRSLIAIVCAALASLFLTSCWQVKYGCPYPDEDQWEDFNDNPADSTDVENPSDTTSTDNPE